MHEADRLGFRRKILRLALREPAYSAGLSTIRHGATCVCGRELGEEQMKTLTVICPAYNEEDVIESFCGELKAVLGGLAGSYEAKIIFIVGGATDATLDILKG